MNRFLCISGVFFFLTVNISVYAEDPPATEVTHHGDTMLQGFRRRALTIDIDARVLDHEQTVVWSETHHKSAIPGNPVGVKVVGSNIVVAVQFTPFIRRHGQNVLVAQGQIWISDPDKGMSYYTSIQTIPLEFGKPVHFFPLGSSPSVEKDSLLEMIITVNPNSSDGVQMDEDFSTEDDK